MIYFIYKSYIYYINILILLSVVEYLSINYLTCGISLRNKVSGTTKKLANK